MGAAVGPGDGAARIAGWYAGYARGEDARALVSRQIEAFTTGTAP